VWALSVSLAASAAAAAPLNASIETPRIAPVIADCEADAPGVGRVFEGTVLQVIDGQTVCLAQGPMPAEWIRVTIAGAPRNSSRGTLMAAAFGQVLDCVVVRAVPAGVEARCEVNGASLERLIATDAARRDGLSWR
jgi:micrococcal nuclease